MLLIAAFLFPVIAGILVSVCKMGEGSRNRWYAAVMIATDAVTAAAIRFGTPITLFRFAENVTMAFSLDALGTYFLIAVLMLYTAVFFYALEYMKMEEILVK